ncbi:hypothetical protein JCM10212_000357 [Sporobolomyces blumeae]
MERIDEPWAWWWAEPAGVQLALERFLPELRDLEQKKVFTSAEINDIVAKRRSFEVSLANGRQTKPIDYLRYIDYEENLEKLRRARVIRMQLTAKKSRSDYSIQFHITQLHRLSVRRFPESLVLWDAYIAHALSQDSPLLVSRTISAAIAMHPTHTPYWVMASQWESEGDEKGMGGGNTEGARRLCMRALRFLKKGKKKVVVGEDGEEEMLGDGDEEAVWKEWIRVEVSFVEKLKSRQQILGLGKGKNGMEAIVRVKGKKAADGESEEEEEGDAEVEVPTLEGEEEEAGDEVQEQVAEKVLSGQEAILDGAIVRAVIDNLLKSYDYSLFAYRFLLSVLRPLPSTLRLSLLAHVYANLTTRLQPSLPSYPAFVHLLATRHLYDVAYMPPKKSKKRTADEADMLEPEDPTQIKVEGEKLVDAVGKAAAEYWTVLRREGKKGKGKGKAKEGSSSMQKVWEQFAAWLEEVAEETDDEDLLAFLAANLSSVLASAPPSPLLSLIQLRHLLRTSAPATETLAHTQQMTKRFGTDSTPASSREQVWVARIETALSLGLSPDEMAPLIANGTRALPFSAKLWDLSAEITEQAATTPQQVAAWYESSIRRSLLTDALPPANFTSSFADFVDVPPRELLPRRFVHYLSTTLPAQLESTLVKLFSTAPTLSLPFLTYVLSLTGPSVSPTTPSSRKFRQKVHERIVAHPEAGPEEWVAYATELLKAGQANESQEVLRRAKGQLALMRGDGEVRRFEREWEAVCSAMEE